MIGISDGMKQSVIDWIKKYFKYIAGIIVILSALFIGKNWIKARVMPKPVVIQKEKAKLNVASDKSFLECIYNQLECAYKSEGQDLKGSCGELNRCDEKYAQ